MASANRPARLNRSLLALLGLVLLAAGVFGVATGIGLVPGLDPAVPLLPAQLALPVWTGYVAIAVAVVVGLLSLRWLLAQALRKPRTGTWRLPAAPIEGGERGSTVIAADRAADALAADIETYPGVLSASAALTGPRHRPDLHLDVTAGTDVVLAELRERLTGHALPRLRSALDIEGLHAQMILRLDTGS
jgi:hypothetical protein